jgi:hypothetical protein
VKRVAAAVVVVAALGCSGSSTDGGDASGSSDGGLTAQQACQDQANARCTRLQACAPGKMQTEFGDQGTCEARYALSCTNALAAPSTGATPAGTEACAQAYAGWECTDFLNDEHVLPACAQATGSVAAGGTCGFNGQCQSGFCAIAPSSRCGTCAAPPAPGDSCAQLTSCGPGLTCTADTQTCVVPAVQGAACGKGAPCGAGLSCVGEQPAKSVQGACQPAGAKAGATCDPTQQTAPNCDHNQGLACNTLTMQCARLVVADGGQPCGTNDVNDQTALCSASGVCTGATPGNPGTCTAAAADGASCSAQGGPGCMFPARCVTSTCQPSSSSCP